MNDSKKIKETDIFDSLNINNKKRISEELFTKLRDAIISGKLPENYSFPSESELCKKLDVGRSTLREAFASLETLNLITRKKNGTYVNEESGFKNFMNFDAITQQTNYYNVFEFRKVLEIGIAGSAAKKAKPEDIIILESIVNSMECNLNDVKTLTICDYEFHSQLAKISDNELLIIAFNATLPYYEKYIFEAFENNIYVQSVSDHKEIIKALEINDAKQARMAMHNHLKHISHMDNHRMNTKVLL